MKRSLLLTCVLALGPAVTVLAQAPFPGPQPPPGEGGPHVLKARELENKPLEERDQKKYDGQITRFQKRVDAAQGRSDQALVASARFDQGAFELDSGQEAAAGETFEQAWQAANSAAQGDVRAALRVLPHTRKHLKVIGGLVAKDPELVLAIMTRLAPAHEQCYQAIELASAKRQYAASLADVWVGLMQQGEMDDETMKTGAFWLLEVPEMIMVNQPLSPADRGKYEQELTFAQIQLEDFRRQVGRRGPGGPRGGPPGVNVNEQLRQLQQQVEQQGGAYGPRGPRPGAEAVTDAKRGPLVKFAEAQVQLKYGQFRDAVKSATEGWEGLVQYYRQNPQGFSPDDVDLHFAGLDEAIHRSPVHALLFMEQLDKVYRAVAQANPLIGLKVADLWSRLTTRLDLKRTDTLEKGVFWLEAAIKQDKELEQQYESTLQKLKTNLEAAKQAEEAEKERAKAGRASPARTPRAPADRAPRERRGREDY